MAQECKGVSRKCGFIVSFQQELGQECKGFSRNWGKCVRRSAGSGAAL